MANYAPEGWSPRAPGKGLVLRVAEAVRAERHSVRKGPAVWSNSGPSGQ